MVLTVNHKQSGLVTVCLCHYQVFAPLWGLEKLVDSLPPRRKRLYIRPTEISDVTFDSFQPRCYCPEV